MTKKKLMVVVGAGASIDFGMPSVNGVDTLFCKWAKENYRLACHENDSLYSYVRDAIESYYRLNKIRYRLKGRGYILVPKMNLNTIRNSSGFY